MAIPRPSGAVGMAIVTGSCEYGFHVGGERFRLDAATVASLRASGASWRAISREMGVALQGRSGVAHQRGNVNPHCETYM